MTKAAWFLVTAPWFCLRAIESENLATDISETETMAARV